MRPCLTCGNPSSASYCTEHEPRPWQHRDGNARDRGYSTAWDKLSRRARRLQPFCSDCGATRDLQLDHTQRTWERVDAGKVVRLRDTGGVVCAACNRRRGAGRGRTDRLEAQGTGPGVEPPGSRGQAESPLLVSDLKRHVPEGLRLRDARLGTTTNQEDSTHVDQASDDVQRRVEVVAPAPLLKYREQSLPSEVGSPIRVAEPCGHDLDSHAGGRVARHVSSLS